MKFLRFFVIILSLLTSSNLFSIDDANLHFTQISTKDGLSQNTVRAIIEDKKGFIWAGTLDGLNRYDGYQIVVYKPQLGQLNSLADHRVKNVYQDKDGYLWIKTYNNEFCCYNPVYDTFIKYLPDTLARINTINLNNYYESSAGDIWLWGGPDGCLRIKKQAQSFLPAFFFRDKNGNGSDCNFLLEDSKNTVWIGGKDGVCKTTENKAEYFYHGAHSFLKAMELEGRIYFATTDLYLMEYDLNRKSFREIRLPNSEDNILNATQLSDHTILIVTRLSGLITYNINTKTFDKPAWTNDPQLRSGSLDFITDKNGGVWIYNHSGIVWYHNRNNQKIKKMELIPPEIAKIIDLERYIIFIDSKNSIWITTYGNGLFRYNPETEMLSNYKYKANQNSPASDYLLDITEDRYGNIWIGSEYAGIIKVTQSDYDIRVVRPETETSIGKNNNVRTIYSDDSDNIWIGTKNGSLYIYDNNLTNGKCIYKDINPYVLSEDSAGNIWVGTKGKGLYLFDQKTLTEKEHYINTEADNSLSYNTIFSILKDSGNRMWIGTFGGGINLAEEIQGKTVFKRFFFNQANRSYIRCLFQDTDGRIWAGSSDGIIRFNPDELIKNPNAFVTFKMNLNDKASINCNDIKTIYESEDSTIWIGTAGGGINKYVPSSGKEKERFVAYTIGNGLSGDFISGIMEDKNDNLWISSESGITKFDKKNNAFIIYKFSEKTYGDQFNENANLYCRNGNMLWGSLDGLLVFNPLSFVPDTNVSPVTLTNFSIFNQPVRTDEKDSPLKQAISYSDKIKLNYKQNTFTFEFASLNLKDPLKNKYVYMLENYDKQWSFPAYLNTATYKNIPPGKYIFKVRGTNSDGIWNDNVTQIDIIITPPFWRSIYAYIIYTLLIIGVLYMAMRLIRKFNILNNNIKVEKELTNFKLRFFTNISHEFRTPLTLIRGAVENLNKRNDIPDKAQKQINILNRNSSVLTRLIDQLLEFRKLQNNVLTLDLEEIDMIDFSREIYNSFREIADQKNIEYLFINNIDHYNMFIDSRKVDKILYNLLSNAFKFTNKNGKIEFVIDMDTNRRVCLIQVKDNGIGIPKDKQDLLFSRFMQINFSMAGTGVGLSLVKEFIDVHKGKIWYESNQEQGSVFNVELSADKEIYHGEHFITQNYSDVLPEPVNTIVLPPSNSGGNIQLPPIENSTLTNFKVLIIDDNDDIRDFLVDEFSKYVQVDSAENGVKGLLLAEEINPDLIICDVMMPEMNGFEVTRRLRDDFQTCHIPIILLTAHSSMEYQLEGIQSGADAYIMKPFSLQYLLTSVFKLIEQREQLKKRFSNEYVLDGNLITTTDKDKEFYNLIDKIMEEHLADSQFSIDQFAESAKLRRTLFYKKIKGITGISPNELIKIKRLKKAAELLLQGNLTVSEISYKVGFEDPFYFSKCFKVQYNCSPSKYGHRATKTPST